MKQPRCPGIQPLAATDPRRACGFASSGHFTRNDRGACACRWLAALTHRCSGPPELWQASVPRSLLRLNDTPCVDGPAWA